MGEPQCFHDGVCSRAVRWITVGAEWKLLACIVMSYALIVGAVVALLVVAGGIGGLFWWVRRTAHLGRHEPGPPLPLFSHDRGSLFRREDDGDDDHTAELMRARSAWRRE